MAGAAPRRALVLGAGIQGTCAALALARRGWAVELLERAPGALQATSVRGEGKLHLGYVYANDPGRTTAALMIEGALRFSRLIESWSPRPIDWSTLRSSPFLYAVPPDTMVAPDRLAEHYSWVDEQVARHLADGGAYAGSDVVEPARPVTDRQAEGLAAPTAAAFATREVAVEPARLRGHLLAALEAHGLAVRGGTTVEGVAHSEHGFVVTARGDDGEEKHRADVVVNCLWDGRLAIDATLGIDPPRPWLYRLKYGVHGQMAPGAASLPSVTIVLGPYGDVVQHASGRIYASWYPACLAGTSDQLVRPQAWDADLSGDDPAADLQTLGEATLAGLGRHVPGIVDLDVDLVAPGVIVAWGETDIDHLDSRLHRRDAVGVHDHDGYLSVDTGKLTTAPLFGERVGEVLGSP